MAYVQPLELTGEQTAERSFLAKVYGWMVAGLSATAFTAWWIARDEALLRGVLSHLQGILLAGFLLPLALSYVVYRMAKPMAVGGFFLYALYEGVVLSVAFAFVDSQVLVSAFLLTG
ncbi:MAG: Bax inhibitor-1 family protein, partial [Planctomycetes bacterium]|nr:Bax inhibitor-1 family protein [Planctomycetota bacterium]